MEERVDEPRSEFKERRELRLEHHVVVLVLSRRNVKILLDLHRISIVCHR